jgi:hypothetical protein
MSGACNRGKRGLEFELEDAILVGGFGGAVAYLLLRSG